MDVTDDVPQNTSCLEAEATTDILEHLTLKDDHSSVPSLEPPLRDSAPSSNSILGSPSKTRPSSVVSTKNTRKRMEDRHVVLHDLKAYLPSALQSKIDPLQHVSYYAVFDGHAGTDAAAYAAAHLHELLVESSSYPLDPVQAFQDAFVLCDKNFVATSKKSGSTAICALIQENMLYIAWLGDSQATLVRNGMPVKVVDAHKPNRDDERARIEGLGGTIMHWGTWRVNGQLAVSRAIGDGEYKPFISADPDVTTIEMIDREEFIIVACDGLWDTVSPEEATDLVFDHLEENKSNGGDVENISSMLATIAKEKGSSDNITVIIIFLKPVEELIKLGKSSNRSHATNVTDTSGVTSTSEFVLCPIEGRDSIEPSKDKPDYTSPNVSFASLEGGAVFSPDPFAGAGSLGNGFNISNENFDNNIEDKRFSNESERPSDEAFQNESMDLLEKQSIDKVDDLLKMLNREDSSPTPDVDDARPLEEILAAAREQPEDDVDGVEDDVDSSDDEIVELRHSGFSNRASNGNSQLDEVLKLDEEHLREGLGDEDCKGEAPSNEPAMDPCEQVTVIATGPEECGTVVPPTQELPSHQEPVIEIVETMTCSMVKEETAEGEVINGITETVSFEGDENEKGFMLKTPGEGEQQLTEFSAIEERETSVDTGEEICQVIQEVETTEVKHLGGTLADCTSSGGLDIPNVQVTPATPTRSRTPEPLPESDSSGSHVSSTDEKENKDTNIKSTNNENITDTQSTHEVRHPSAIQENDKSTNQSVDKKGASDKKELMKSKTVSNSEKSGTVGVKSKPGPLKTNSNSKPAAARGSSTATAVNRAINSKTTSTTSKANSRPSTTSSVSSNPSSSRSKVAAKSEKVVEPVKKAAKPAPVANRLTERKPLVSKSSDSVTATTRTAVSKSIPSKSKLGNEKSEVKSDVSKRPTSSTSSTLSRPPSTKVKSTPAVSRQASNASSSSGVRPRPPAVKSTVGTSNRVGMNKTISGTPNTPTSSNSKTPSVNKQSTSLSRSSSSATSRPTTAGRTTTSTTASKPTAAAARVAAAREAAKGSRPGVPSKSKILTTIDKKSKSSTIKNVETNEIVSDSKESNGDKSEDAGKVAEATNHVVTGEGIVTSEEKSHLNGEAGKEQSSEC